MKCLQYLLNNGCPSDVTAYVAAVSRDRLDSIQYLHVNGVAWDATVSSAAVELNNSNILQYLLHHKCPVGPGLLNFATQSDRTSCVKVLRAAGIQWDTAQGPDICVCLNAIRGCEVNALQRAVENGCALDAILCVEAVKMNRLAMLTFLHEAGCPWDAHTTAAAVERDLYQLLHYAVTNGCPVEVSEMALAAAPRCALFMATYRASGEKRAKREAASQQQSDGCRH